MGSRRFQQQIPNGMTTRKAKASADFYGMTTRKATARRDKQSLQAFRLIDVAEFDLVLDIVVDDVGIEGELRQVLLA